MPILIENTEFFTVCEVANELGISRQTLWRWRKHGDVPAGRRYRRGRQIVFSQEDIAIIRDYANRLEPAETGFYHQLPLFGYARDRT